MTGVGVIRAKLPRARTRAWPILPRWWIYQREILPKALALQSFDPTPSFTTRTRRESVQSSRWRYDPLHVLLSLAFDVFVLSCFPAIHSHGHCARCITIPSSMSPTGAPFTTSLHLLIYPTHSQPIIDLYNRLDNSWIMQLRYAFSFRRARLGDTFQI